MREPLLQKTKPYFGLHPSDYEVLSHLTPIFWTAHSGQPIFHWSPATANLNAGAPEVWLPESPAPLAGELKRENM